MIDLENMSILVVDDMKSMRLTIRKMLRNLNIGKMLRFADNGKAGLEILRATPCDMAIIDWNMPVMNGLEFVKRLKADETTKVIPVVVVSTEGAQVKIKEFMDSGASGYITKPFSAESIRDLMVNLLGEVEYDEDIDDADEEFDF